MGSLFPFGKCAGQFRASMCMNHCSTFIGLQNSMLGVRDPIVAATTCTVVGFTARLNEIWF